MKKTLGLFFALFLVLVLASPSLAGSISGKVTFDGKAPAPRVIKVDKDKKVCGNEKVSEVLLVGKGGGIKDVVIRVKGATGGKWGFSDATINQEGCQFSPHITLMKPGAKLTMLNPDGITHNMHTFSIENPAINKAQPKFKKKMRIKGKLKTPETVKLGCDIHKKWMSAWIIVADTPFITVSAADGSFKIGNLPDGDYELEIWQEKLGSQTQKVSVKGDTKVSVSYKK